MPVRRRFTQPRASVLATTLMLAILAGCSRDDSVTGPDQGLESLDVRASAAAHYADGYVWANQPTIASYTPATIYSFNQSGKAITITRQGIGTYTVRFAGLSAVLGSKSTVHVTGYGADNSYCKPVGQKLLNDVVKIKCVDGGRPADAFYTVHISKTYGDVAFAYANQPTTNDYAPPGGASHNPAGAIRVLRIGVGAYQVFFMGFGSKLISNKGHAQAVAIGTGAQHCQIQGWAGNPDLGILVTCYSRDRVKKDVKFNVFFATPAANLAYAYADQLSTPSYSPDPNKRYNPSGGGVTITRSEKGRYTVTWSGLSLLDRGDVQVTSGSGAIVCKVEGWIFAQARVRCFDPATNVLSDSRFTVMYFS